MSMDMSRYLDLFLSESGDHLDAADDLLGDLRAGTGEGVIDPLFRHVHSLKGMAATMGFTGMVQVAHTMEDLLDAVRAGTAGVDLEATCSLLWEALAHLGGAIDAVRAGTPLHAEASEAVTARLVEELSRLHGEKPPGRSGPSPAPGSSGEDVPAGDCWRVEVLLPAGGAAFARQAVRTIGELGRLGEIRRISPPLPDPAGRPGRGRLILSVKTGNPRQEIENELRAIEGLAGFSLEREEAEKTAAPEAERPPGEPSRFVRVRAGMLDSLVEHALELVLAHEDLASSPPPAGRWNAASTA
jgi:two-component system chemotaxis sensor kinase CheA